MEIDSGPEHLFVYVHILLVTFLWPRTGSIESLVYYEIWTNQSPLRDIYLGEHCEVSLNVSAYK